MTNIDLFAKIKAEVMRRGDTDLLAWLDTIPLEGVSVDIETEIAKAWVEWGGKIIDLDAFADIAEHFYELGRSAK